MRRALVLVVPSLLLASPAIAAQPVPPADGVPLLPGDVVQFDLGALPDRYEGGGKVTCRGTVLRATGPEEETCTQRYRFEVPADSARLTYVFREKTGGRERSIDLPLTRSSRPVTFTVAAPGTLVGPKPVTIPAAVADGAARRAAGVQCGACRGGAFAFESHEVTDPPKPVGGSVQIRLKITSPPRPAAAAGPAK